MNLRHLVGLLLLAAASGAGAQTAKPLALQTYSPPPAGDRFLSLRSPDVPEGLDPRAALVLSWANDPLVLTVDGTVPAGGEIVKTQFWGFLQGAAGFFGRLLVDVTLPVALYQSGSQPLPDLPQVASSGIGDLTLGARLRLPALGTARTALAASVMLPTGSTAAYASDGSLRAELSAVVGGEWGHGDYGAELGLQYRSTRDGARPVTGPGLIWRAGAAWRQGNWRVGPELYGRYQFSGTDSSPAEYLVAGHYRWGAWEGSLGAGGQLDQAPGAAPQRVVVRATWYPGGDTTATAEAARAAQEKAEADRLAAERLAAEKAAAERAAAEQAAREKAAAEQAALARAEADRLAAERLAAEKAAALAAAAAIAAGNGDRDGDGIPDAEDACPDEKGVPNPDPKRNGCPVTAVIRNDKIEILQSIQFETDKDVLRPASIGILRDVANVLKAHPEIRRVRVEGHTDSQGGADHNTRLSEARARAVKGWLVEQGAIAAGRLETMGYGQSKPIGSNDTAEGRARNRRVEFRIEEK